MQVRPPPDPPAERHLVELNPQLLRTRLQPADKRNVHPPVAKARGDVLEKDPSWAGKGTEFLANPCEGRRTKASDPMHDDTVVSDLGPGRTRGPDVNCSSAVRQRSRDETRVVRNPALRRRILRGQEVKPRVRQRGPVSQMPRSRHPHRRTCSRVQILGTAEAGLVARRTRGKRP